MNTELKDSGNQKGSISHFLLLPSDFATAQTSYVDEKQGAGRRLMRLGTVLSVVLIGAGLYIASTGPAYWLAARGHLPRELLQLYEPLEFIDDVPLLKRAIEWYLYEFWRVDPD